MAFGVAKIGSTMAQFFSSFSTARAVEGQAKVTGGALNIAAQSSMQSESDKKLRAREDRLLGRKLAIDASAALEPAHTATGEDARSPTERRNYRNKRGGGQKHGGGQQGQGHGYSEEDGFGKDPHGVAS